MSEPLVTRRPRAGDVGRFASARFAYPHDLSHVRAEGVVMAYCDGPSVLIQAADGEAVWWRADLTLLSERETDERQGGAA